MILSFSVFLQAMGQRQADALNALEVATTDRLNAISVATQQGIINLYQVRGCFWASVGPQPQEEALTLRVRQHQQEHQSCLACSSM